MCSFHSKYVSRSGVYYSDQSFESGPDGLCSHIPGATGIHADLRSMHSGTCCTTYLNLRQRKRVTERFRFTCCLGRLSHLFLDFSIVSICLNIALPYPTRRVICCGFPCVTYENTPYIYDTFSIKYRVKCSFKNNILRLHTTCQCKRSIPADALSRSLNWGPG